MQNNINYATLSMNDIIFQGRNKEYGAYELRESYNRRIKHAMLGTLFITAFACSYQTIASLYHPVKSVEEPIVQVELSKQVEITTPKTLDPPKPKPLQAPKGTPDPPMTTAAAILVPTDNNKPSDSIPTNDQLAHSAIGEHNTPGTTPGTTVGIPAGSIVASVSTTAVLPAFQTVNVAEEMPEYPGGEQAMMAFLGNTLQYPEMDKDLGIQGKVMVGFTVDENGKPTDMKILKGISRSIDEESLRVVGKLKNFKPGMQSGHRVRVRMILPISYKIKGD
ncbi:MAG: hypothetical protein JWO03_1617 [Bacteroidetes bacterium]|nr:hypothetical protein [Bacteroidota bacterium]